MSVAIVAGDRARMPGLWSERAFLGAGSLLFLLCTVATVASCRAMAGMPALPMPGGWALSMAWTPLCGQRWSGVAASLFGNWNLMMAAMMLPSLLPMLLRLRRTIGAASPLQRERLTAVAALGYFAFWAAAGAVVVPLGLVLAELALQRPALARAAPLLGGLLVTLAGVLQFSAWKARRLACCRGGHGHRAPMGQAGALRQGLMLGLHCSRCCAGLTAVLLVLGMMDLRVMAAVTAANTLERLAPDGERAARAVGWAVVAAGVLLVARAAGSA